MKKTVLNTLRGGVSKIASSVSGRWSVFRIIALCTCTLLTAVQPLTANAYDSASVRSAIRNGQVSSQGIMHPTRPYFCVNDDGSVANHNAGNIGRCPEGQTDMYANVVIDPISRYATDCSDSLELHYGYLSPDGNITRDARFYRVDSKDLNCQCGRNNCHDKKNWNNKTAPDGNGGSIGYLDPNFGADATPDPTVPNACESGKKYRSGLCYTDCKSGYSSDGMTMCYQNCPDGWSATTTSCTKKTYTRSVGTIPKYGMDCSGSWTTLKCKATSSCPGDKQNEDGLCYDKPKSGYACTALTCWQSCPSGMTDFGVGCMKGSYSVGTGTAPGCPSDKVRRGELCYPRK